MNTITAKTCQACGKPVRGRVDKKFCDDYCRNLYNNQLKSRFYHNEAVKTVNSFLLRNRKVLERLLPSSEETARTHKEKLLRLGFSFKYLTHRYTTKNGKTYVYCYDYGYLPLQNDWYLIVRNKDD